MQVVLIGAGRLATQLGLALRRSGHDVTAVYSRTMESAETLAGKIGCRAVNAPLQLPQEADVFILSVKDSAMESLIPQITSGREGQLFVHTAGSMSIELLQGHARRYGVFYPMQSFSKERQVDFSEIPLFIEASDSASLAVIKTLAMSLSHKVYELSSDERKYLHLAAVFACNFANHCYALSSKILEQHGMPFSVMLPLIDETARKVHQLHPIEAQTGPAVRFDENVINMQRELLAGQPEMQQLYQLFSESIHRIHNEKA